MLLLGSSITKLSFLSESETATVTCPNCLIEGSVVVLDTFPVDIDELFWIDDAAKQAEVLNEIGNGSIVWPITPWGAHYISNHNEGVDHWYINTYQLAHVVAPHAGVATATRGIYGTNIIMQNGSEVVEDCQMEIDIGDDCFVMYGHLNLFKTIYDEIQATGSYTFTEGEHIGYSRDSTWGGFDFYYCTHYRMICPLHAFNASLQTKINNYYNMQIPKAKIAGVFPEIDICNNVSIAIENTFWGVWNYSTGYLDSYHHSSPWYEGKIITIFNRNFANPESFYRDWKNRNLNITDDIIGIYSENRGIEIPEFNTTDNSYIKTIEGDFSTGIIEIIFNSYDGEWGGMNDSIYMRYEVSNNDIGFRDDTLIVEFYPELIDAQAGFTENNLTYNRFFHWWNEEREEETTKDGSILLMIPITVVFTTLTVLRKRKQQLEQFLSN